MAARPVFSCRHAGRALKNHFSGQPDPAKIFTEIAHRRVVFYDKKDSFFFNVAPDMNKPASFFLWEQ